MFEEGLKKWKFIPLNTMKGLVLGLLLTDVSSKSPDYIGEKVERVMAVTKEEDKYVLMQMLHPLLRADVEDYAEHWIRNIVSVEFEDE